MTPWTKHWLPEGGIALAAPAKRPRSFRANIIRHLKSQSTSLAGYYNPAPHWIKVRPGRSRGRRSVILIKTAQVQFFSFLCYFLSVVRIMIRHCFLPACRLPPLFCLRVLLGISPFNRISPVLGLYFYLSDLIIRLGRHRKPCPGAGPWLPVQGLSGVASVTPGWLPHWALHRPHATSAQHLAGHACAQRQQLNQNKFHSLQLWLGSGKGLISPPWLATFRPRPTDLSLNFRHCL